MDTEQNKNIQKEEAGFGPMIGILVIVLIMIVGAVYYGASETKKIETLKKAAKEAQASSTITEIISSSTDAAIQ